MTRRLLPILILNAIAAAAVMAEPPLPYGPVEMPMGKRTSVMADRTVSLTIEALARTIDPPTRVRLIADLGHAHSNAARGALLKLLHDPETLVRAQAVRALGSGSEVSALMGDASPLVRREVVLSTTDDALLAKGLDDADGTVRIAALSRSISEKSDALLAARLAALGAPEQALVCRTLGQRKAAAAAASIESLLQADNMLPRVAAIEALAAMQKLTIAQLAPQLAHPHPAVRRAASAALAALPAADRTTPAVGVLNDKDLGVRIAAAGVLADVGDAKTVSPLLAQFTPDDDDLTQATRSALTAIAARDPAARAQVDAAAGALLAAPDAHGRCNGSFLLGALRSITELNRHIALLNDADWLVVKQAAMSLGQIADASAAPALAAAAQRAAGIDDPNFATWTTTAKPDQTMSRFSAGEQAILSCVALGYAPVIAAVQPVIPLKTGPEQIRLAAVWAIGVLQPSDAARPTLHTLINRLNDELESQSVVAEAIKAAGNARVAALAPQLTTLRDGNLGLDSYIASLALDRIQGTHTAIPAQDGVEIIDTVIRDQTPAPTPAAK